MWPHDKFTAGMEANTLEVITGKPVTPAEGNAHAI